MGFDEPVFMGVYSKTSKFGTRQKVRGFNRWHAWGLDDGSFMVQQVNTLGEGQDEPLIVDPEDFFKNYRVSVALSAKQEAVPPNYKRPEPRRRAARSGAADTARAAGVYNLQDSQVVEARASEPAAAAQPGRPWRGSATALLSIVSLRDLYSTARPGIEQGERRAENTAAERPDASAEKPLPLPPFSVAGAAGGAAVKADESAAGGDDRSFKDSREARHAEQRLRSEFSRALLQLRASRGSAIRDLHKLADISCDSLQKGHKYLFTEFGMTLRRRQLFALACRYHEKARQLAPDDEHVLFNLARSLYDSGDLDLARERLEDALRLAPGFKAGWDFLAFLNYGRTVDK